MGCNGKSGYSGRNAHKRAGESVCETCLIAVRWAERERRRGQTYPRILKGCGSRAAAERHRVNNEPLDFACSVAEANYHRENRDARLEAQLEEVVL